MQQQRQQQQRQPSTRQWPKHDLEVCVVRSVGGVCAGSSRGSTAASSNMRSCTGSWAASGCCTPAGQVVIADLLRQDVSLFVMQVAAVIVVCCSKRQRQCVDLT
jgi:hypothetical protein